MYFVPQFTEATAYRYNKPRKCNISNEILRIYRKIIASSSNNIFYIQIHNFTQQTMLNQTLYYTIQYREPNTKSKGVLITPFLAHVTINSLVAMKVNLIHIKSI